MTFEQLRIFVTVAELSHVTRAARALNMTQSAVSAAIRTLEQTHDVRLFDRIGRGIALTEAGHAFLDSARQVLGAAEAARLALDDLSGTPRGRLRLQASQTIATYVLPPLLVRLRAQWPLLSITLEAGNTAGVARAVAEGQADIGFVEGDVAEPSLVRRVFARDELVLVMSRDHPLRHKPAFDAGDYRAFRWVLREEGSGTRAEVEGHLAVMGLSHAALDVALTLHSNEAVLSALRAGQAVAMLSRRAAEWAGPGEVVCRTVTWSAPPERAFATLTHPARHRTRAAQALLALLGEGDGPRAT